MEESPYPEDGWIQESIRETRLETRRVGNLELEMLDGSFLNYHLIDIRPSFRFRVGETNYTLFTETLLYLSATIRYLYENHPLDYCEEVALVVYGGNENQVN